MTKRKVTTEAPKPAPKSEAPKPKLRAKKITDGVITLHDLCAELRHDPKMARAKLRAAITDEKTQYPALAKSHAPRKAWEWENGSAAIAEARKVLAN